MIKEAATILLASVLSLTCMHSNAVEPEVSTLTCKDTKTAPPHVSRWKAVQPAVQEVTVNCGAQTVVMSPMPATSDKGSVEENAQQMWWMRLIEAILEFLGEIAWPIAAIVIGLKFKKELAALLIRLKRGKLGSAEFEFERYVDAVDAETEIPRMPDVEAISPKVAIRATVDPRGAIVGAWIEVEEALLNLIQNRELSEPAVHSKSRGLVSAINAVQRAQVLDSSWVALFHDLRVMRNEAAHSTEFTPPPESVIKYVQLAKELTNAMRTAADQKNG